MSIRQFHELINAPAPGFWCNEGGQSPKERFLTRIEHILNPPASADDIANIERMIGDFATKVVEFYKVHNGFLLYKDMESGDGGVELFKVEDWESSTSDLKELYEHLEEDEDPDCILSGIAIGEIPASANYFVMPVDGPNRGKIFYVDHDGWYDEPFADNFDDFLLRLTKDPANLISEELGCFADYTDTESGLSGYPEEYLDDVTKII